MRIGIDVRMWREKGVGRYVRGLIKELAILPQDYTYVLFCLSRDVDDIKRVVPRQWVIQIVDIRWYTLTEQLVMPFHYYAARLHLLHIPHFNVPVLYRKPIIVTIHDLTHFSFKMTRASRLPGWVYSLKHIGYDVVFADAVQRAVRVLTVSEYVRQDIIKKFKRTEDKIVVTYEAAEQCTVISADKILRLLSDFNVIKRYFYYIGNAHPHKNLEFLLKAFQQFRVRFPDSQLVLSGDDDYFWPRLKKWAIYEHLSEGVVFTGAIEDSVKDAFLRGAVGYIFPSLSEGFGLPMLEAMQCGCPVLASNKTSLPEIGGSAVHYFDPNNTESLIAVMRDFYTSEEMRKNFITRGYARVNDFSWRTMVKETVKQYSLTI